MQVGAMMPLVRPIDEEYREAEAQAYRSMVIGCLLVAIALVVACGRVVFFVLWYTKMPWG